MLFCLAALIAAAPTLTNACDEPAVPATVRITSCKTNLDCGNREICEFPEDATVESGSCVPVNQPSAVPGDPPIENPAPGTGPIEPTDPLEKDFINEMDLTAPVTSPGKPVMTAILNPAPAEEKPDLATQIAQLEPSKTQAIPLVATGGK